MTAVKLVVTSRRRNRNFVTYKFSTYDVMVFFVSRFNLYNKIVDVL